MAHGIWLRMTNPGQLHIDLNQILELRDNIIACGFYVIHPIFHCGLYSKTVCIIKNFPESKNPQLILVILKSKQ